MFIYPCFRGDENSSLREVQCNLFMSTVGIIVHEAHANYFKAEKLLNIKTTLGDKILIVNLYWRRYRNPKKIQQGTQPQATTGSFKIVN